MFLLQQFAPAVIVAIIAVMLAVGITRWLSADWAKEIAFAVAVGAGYAAGHVKSTSWPAFPPVDATHWLLFLALGSILIGTFHAIARRHAAFLRSALFGVLLLATLGLLLRPKFKLEWSSIEGSMWIAGLTLVGCMVGWSIDWAIRSQPSRFSLLFLLVLGSGSSVALAFSGSLLLAQLAAVYSGVTFAVIAAGAIAGNVPGRSLVPCLATLFVGLITCGYWYADLPWNSGLLLAVAPASVFVVPSKSTPVRQALIRAAVAAIFAVLAVLLARRASPPIDYY